MKRLHALLPVALLAGCVAVPTGPRVAVMPAPGKPFDLFVLEERECRRYAEQSIGLTRNDVSAQNVVGSAAVGTAVGAAAGALVGGERGAAAGAGVGLLAGTASGSSQAAYAGADAQRRYDVAYQQCMYAKGNQIPGYAQPYRYRQWAPAEAPVETPYYYPPPPPRR